MSSTAKHTSGERRYRGKQSRPIPVWNGVLEHRERIDAAIWTFLWLLDGITKERDGVGIVLGGAPVKAIQIATELKFHERTVREHLESLDKGKYIRRRLTPRGYVFEVLNSRKFGIWKAHKRSEEKARPDSKWSEEIPGQVGPNGPVRSEENTRRNKDAAVDAAKRRSSNQPHTKPAQEDSVWGFLEIPPVVHSLSAPSLKVAGQPRTASRARS